MRWSVAYYFLFVTAVFAADLHVAPTGRDDQPGTAEKPFATLSRARDEIRLLKANGPLPTGGITVWVHAGNYELARSLDFTAQDSGTKDAPITYQAVAGQPVRILGGKAVTGWKTVVDPAVLNRLDPVIRGKVWQADLRALGLTDFGAIQPGKIWGQSEAGLEFFFRDQPMPLARWPNDGLTRVIAARGPTAKDNREKEGTVEGILAYDGDRPQRWLGEPDAMLHGFWFYDWADQRQKIAAIDPAKHLISLAPPHHDFGYRQGQWFYAYNILTELDRPGEWYLDRKAGLLYFYPPADPSASSAIVSVLPTLITFTDAAHIRLRGFTLECAQKTAVTMSGGSQLRIAACTIRNCGSWAVTLVGGTQHGILGCNILHTGDGGVAVGAGDRKTLTPAGHVVDNCHIHHYSRWNPVYQPAIRLDGVGNRASHNLIHHAPHMAIQFSGNDHLIELNEIHSVVQQSNDAGVIYAGADLSARGHLIRHNYLHHVYGRQGKGCVGVYLDDNFSSATVFGNVFYHVPKAAFIGGGRDCTIENNIFLDCSPAVFVDARGLGWRNYGLADFTQKLQAVPYQQPPWTTRFPQLTKLLADEPLAPKGNVITKNISVGGQWTDIEDKAKRYLTLSNNLTNVDPKFVNPQGGDYRLQVDSPALNIGFQPIPFEQIGLYGHELRATWPVPHEPHVPPNKAASSTPPFTGAKPK